MIRKLAAVLLISTSLVACSSDRKVDNVDSSLEQVSGVSDYSDTGSTYGDYNSISSEQLDDLEAGSQEQLVALAGEKIYFNFNSSDINTNAQKTLMRQASWLKEYPTVNVLIEGHADERGTREYNLALGEKRANAAKDFLIKNGIASSRISIISYGKENPEAPGSNEAAWSKNRRAVTVVAR